MTVNGLADHPCPENSDLPLSRGADHDGTKRATMSLLAFLGVCKSAGLVAPAAKVALTFGGDRCDGGLVKDTLGIRRGRRLSACGHGGGGGVGFVGGTGGSTLGASAEVTAEVPDESFLVSYFPSYIFKLSSNNALGYAYGVNKVSYINHLDFLQTMCCVIGIYSSTSQCDQVYCKVPSVEPPQFLVVLLAKRASHELPQGQLSPVSIVVAGNPTLTP